MGTGRRPVDWRASLSPFDTGRDDGVWKINEIVAIDPTQIKSATDNIGTFDGNNKDIRYSISPVWTGSAADYDKPSLQYIGSGEGAQAFGWGLYGSDQEGIAKWYAHNDLVDKRITDAEDFGYFMVDGERDTSEGGYLSGKKQDEYLDELFDKDVFENDTGSFEIERVVNEIYDAAGDCKWDIDKAVAYAEKELEDETEENPDYRKIFDFIKDKIKSGELSMNPPDGYGKHHLYKQTFWPGKQENLIRWDEPVKEEFVKEIADKVLTNYRSDHVGEEIRDQIEGMAYQDYTGQEFYEEVSRLVSAEEQEYIEENGELSENGFQRDPKAASEFLYACGVDGIQYPAADSDGSEGWNYVAFSDKDIRVDEHMRYSIQAEEEQGKSLEGVNEESLGKKIKAFISSGLEAGKLRFKHVSDRRNIFQEAMRFFREFSKKQIPLSDGRCVYFMPDSRALERLNGERAGAWAEYSIHAVTSSGEKIPGKEFAERLFNKTKAENLDRIEPVIKEENVFSVLKNDPLKDSVVFYGTAHDGKRMEIITRLDEYGNVNADLTEVTVLTKGNKKESPPPKSLTEVVKTVAHHQETGYSPSTKETISQSGEKVKGGLEENRKNPTGRTDSEGMRYSISPENENLIVVHNVSARKLRNAAKLGGMPVPSMAIVDAEKSDFSKYGEITLIADKSMIDPKVRGNKVYNADVYSPRAPYITKEYSDTDYDRSLSILKPYDSAEKNSYDSAEKVITEYKKGMRDSDFEEALRRLPAVRKWFSETEDADSDFESWWQDIALKKLDLHPYEKIFNGHTPSGKKKWIPATLDNVVKLMTKKVRNGEGFHYGIGNIRSMKAVQFKSISQIQKARENIVSSEAMKQVKEDIQSELDELNAKMESQSHSGKFGWSYNTGEDCLLAMAEGGYENKKYLRDRFGDNEELFRDMAEFLDKLCNMPTEYFEAKPQRAVSLEEFKAAVIPLDTPSDVRDLLSGAGVSIYTYDKEKKDRKAVVSKATEDTGVRFSIVGEEGAKEAARVSFLDKVLEAFEFVRPWKETAVARFGNLRIAKEMREKGLDYDRIKAATGWERGRDGKWRTETADSWDIAAKRQESTLGESLKGATELFKLYPELKNVGLSLVPMHRGETGSYFPKSNRIALNSHIRPKERKMTLIHEIQHWIQNKEGFTGGGAAEQFRLDEDLKNYAELVEQSENYRKLAEKSADALAQGGAAEREVRELLSKPDVREIISQRALLMEKYAKDKTALEFLENPEMDAEQFAFDRYHRLAGEVEARNAETRSMIPLAERERTRLRTTEDVPEAEKIYSTGDSSERMASEGEHEFYRQMKQVKNTRWGDLYHKAPNRKESNLNERAWVLARTPNFKSFFGDWENAAKLKLIRNAKTIQIVPDTSGKPVEEIYRHLGTGKNRLDGRNVRFVNAALGKILRHKGFDTAKIIPQLKEIYEESVKIDSQTEREQNVRPDGTVHKKHPNYAGYHNYLAKIELDGKKFFVRITVDEEKSRNADYIPNQFHSTYVSDMEIYNADKSLSQPTLTVDEREKVGVDDILHRILDKIKSDSEKVSEKVDENGEPQKKYVDEFDSNEDAKYGRLDESEPETKEPDRGGMRYSIVGEESMERAAKPSFWELIKEKFGVRKLWREAVAKRLDELGIAQELESRGLCGMERIKAVTGWELGENGEWRTNVPDNWKLAPTRQESTLGESLYGAEELFGIYPELKKVELSVRKLESNELSRYSPEENRITLNSRYHPETRKSALEGEIQKWIRNREGLPISSAPSVPSTAAPVAPVAPTTPATHAAPVAPSSKTAKHQQINPIILLLKKTGTNQVNIEWIAISFAAKLGDELNVIFAEAGFNFRKLLLAFALFLYQFFRSIFAMGLPIGKMLPEKV